jgi:hypothetical protein
MRRQSSIDLEFCGRVQIISLQNFHQLANLIPMKIKNIPNPLR